MISRFSAPTWLREGGALVVPSNSALSRFILELTNIECSSWISSSPPDAINIVFEHLYNAQTNHKTATSCCICERSNRCEANYPQSSIQQHQINSSRQQQCLRCNCCCWCCCMSRWGHRSHFQQFADALSSQIRISICNDRQKQFRERENQLWVWVIDVCFTTL